MMVVAHILECCSINLKKKLVNSVVHPEYYKSDVRVRVTLQLAAYRQSVRLGDKPLEVHDQNFYFSTEHLQL
jgi:hypothetical protein